MFNNNSQDNNHKDSNSFHISKVLIVKNNLVFMGT
jgi:hypothetical protein